MSFRLGDEVLAPWLSDGFCYPAILVAVNGPTAHVAYLDGDEHDVPMQSLRLGVFGPGVSVEVNWKGKRKYYRGVITQRLGMAVFIAYETGEKEWATIAQCRILINVAQALPPSVSACIFCGAAMSGDRCPQCGAPRGGRA